MILSQVEDFFNRYGVDPNSTFLLAVSGGIDSMCLWHVFRKMNLKFYVAHVNFGLRDDESDGDEDFIRSFSNKKEQLHFKRVDTSNYASEKNLSIQMAARELRYQWFDEVRREHSIDYLVTAHHKDDRIENFFIKLARQSSLFNSWDITPASTNLIRPFSEVSRRELEVFANEENIEYREDSSNSSSKYLRNRIRHEIIPAIEEVEPGIKESTYLFLQELTELRNNMKIVQDDLELKWIQVENENEIVSLKDSSNPMFGMFLRFWLESHGAGKRQAKDALELIHAQSGRFIQINEYRLIRDRDRLILSKNRPENVLMTFSKHDLLEGLVTEIKSQALVPPLTSGTFKEGEAYFDFDSLDEELALRKWEKGDSFQPLGMEGKKKLSDYFIDEKLSQLEKEEQMILLSGNDICWVVGRRIDDRFKIRPNTKLVLNLAKH